MKKGQNNKVYKLKKTLYGLNQALRAWFTRIDAYFVEHGFIKCIYEHTLYIKGNPSGDILIVYLYVDDLIFTDNNSKLIYEFKETTINHFWIIDL